MIIMWAHLYYRLLRISWNKCLIRAIISLFFSITSFVYEIHALLRTNADWKLQWNVRNIEEYVNTLRLIVCCCVYVPICVHTYLTQVSSFFHCMWTQLNVFLFVCYSFSFCFSSQWHFEFGLMLKHKVYRLHKFVFILCIKVPLSIPDNSFVQL